MALPESPLATGVAEVAGVQVAFRSLSRAEAVQLRDFAGRTNDAEAFIVSAATGVSVEESAAWLGSVDVRTGGSLVDQILALSGLSPNTRPSSKRSSGA